MSAVPILFSHSIDGFVSRQELENWESKMSKEVSTMTKCYNSLRVSEIDNEQLVCICVCV